jgi:hypothetical protein
MRPYHGRFDNPNELEKRKNVLATLDARKLFTVMQDSNNRRTLPRPSRDGAR